MIGALLCFVGLHRWAPFGSASHRYRICRRAGCSVVQQIAFYSNRTHEWVRTSSDR